MPNVGRMGTQYSVIYIGNFNCSFNEYHNFLMNNKLRSIEVKKQLRLFIKV